MEARELREQAENMVKVTEAWVGTIGNVLDKAVNEIPDEDFADAKNVKAFEDLEGKTNEMTQAMNQLKKLSKDMRF